MIAVITYDAPHRKTQDVVFKLILNGYRDIQLVVLPWVKRKNFQAIYSHRPSSKVQLTIEQLAQRMHIQFERVSVDNLHTYFGQHSFDHILIAGAGLLPDVFAMNHKIINAHPGYLPNSKGLDAFKWAIYQGQPLGVTSHYISEKADEGKLIDKKIIPVYAEDSFHSLAYRIYETEIEMLVDSISRIEKNEASLASLADDVFEATRRMPNRLEPEMMERFEKIRAASKSKHEA